MEHVLITGAAGVIGRAAVSHFRSIGVRVTALVLDDPGDLVLDRVVVGNASDRAVVADALDGVDAVVHLAAIPRPVPGASDAVFAGNTAATFAVLDAAGERGIRRAAIASSVNALGIGWSAEFGAGPVYVPLDEDHPSQAADPYSLSKQVDEITAAAVARRYGMTVVALRFPFVGSLDGAAPGWDLTGRAARFADDPALGTAELWLYLETRDAARALELALQVPEPGAHAVFVAADRTVVPYRTEDLLDAYHPVVPRRRALPGRTAPVDLSRAARLLGFTANHLLPGTDEIRDLPTRA